MSINALPKVSVAMVTYNHEKFVIQAVESALRQTTNFTYEIVIGEDCSPDRTRDQVLELQSRHPSRIRVILADRNTGGMDNFVRTFQACRGEYVALLDGDDYWTDPRKLQIQADFLDSHPGYAFCFHNVTKIYDDESRESSLYCSIEGERTFTLSDLLARNFIPTCSVMARNRLIQDFPDWFLRLNLADWPLHVLNAQHGDIGYLNEVMAVYRVHGASVWSGAAKVDRLLDQIGVYQAFSRHLDAKYRGAIRTALSECYGKLSSQYERRHDRSNARRYAIQALTTGFYQKGADRKDLFARVLGLHVPRLRSIVRAARKTLSISRRRSPSDSTTPREADRRDLQSESVSSERAR
jgi:glycosyltransferase involved in cell wall biosynthesis